jgi:mannose-6-phosphate isomerase class I
MTGYQNYDREPVVEIQAHAELCLQGWAEICARLAQGSALHRDGSFRIALECYPGVDLQALTATLQQHLPSAHVLNAETAFQSSSALRRQFETMLTDDPVFAVMQPRDIAEFFDHHALERLRAEVEASTGLLVLVGTGTALLLPEPDLLLHAGVTRWELQRRQRAHSIGNLGLNNSSASPAELYKIAFFLEWRTADRIRHELYPRIDFFLDLEQQEDPRMLAGDTLRAAMEHVVQRPFRVVPFFDPGPWGGQWMRETLGLPDGPPNYAWCFDCVPEENGLTLGFGDRRFRLPALIAVHEQPAALLGHSVYEQFGAEFPIRFDLLDTVGGGNLSLQVHPLTSYIREHFGMPYTQDESYYILDCTPGSQLYLGLREGVDPAAMAADLAEAQTGTAPFPADKYINLWPTTKHDHFSIPAGTVHCSGAGTLVLEISATPYIFTFKLWDWGRVGLDGRPRPIHLAHGLENIQWNRDTAWVQRELIDQVEVLGERPGVREERTGLHAAEFLETRRTWFTEPVLHDTEGNLHVLNLVEGRAAVVESPTGAFAPLEIHYAETFIVPAAVGPYVIRPAGEVSSPLAVVKAYVRPQTASGAGNLDAQLHKG